MSTRTPFSRAQGMGAAHSGVGHFWRQRVSAVALVPLSVWFAWSALSLIGANREAVIAFLKMPVNAISMAFFVVAATYHMALGVQVVIEDYVERDGGKIALLVLNQYFAWVVAAASLFALVKIAL